MTNMFTPANSAVIFWGIYFYCLILWAEFKTRLILDEVERVSVLSGSVANDLIDGGWTQGSGRAGKWIIKLGIQTAARNKSSQRLVFVLTQLHFGQWGSLPFCLLNLIAQWPRQNDSLIATRMIVKLTYSSRIRSGTELYFIVFFFISIISQ